MRGLFILFFLISPISFGKTVLHLTVKDSINPGSADYIVSGIDSAEKQKAYAVLITLDTPGGLLTSTRQIVQKILSTPLPVIVWIAPQGAQAGSAGALITLAADVAAMAPGTNIGAAHPVSPGSSSQGDSRQDKILEQKMANDTAAFAESVAKSRGRNTQWAIASVKQSASIIPDEALKLGVIDLVAATQEELIVKLYGFKLRAPKGNIQELNSVGATLESHPMGLKHRLISFFADPNIAYILLSLAGLCIWIELSNPGVILPGVLGGISLLISLVSFQLLPISYGALGLVFLGLGLLIAELFVPSFGVLGLGGIASFIIGSLYLVDSSAPDLQISLSLILPTAAVLSVAALGLSVLVLRAQRKKPLSGLRAMVGELAQTQTEITSTLSAKPGVVLVHGELWNALSSEEQSIPSGRTVVVTEVRDMLLVVRPA